MADQEHRYRQDIQGLRAVAVGAIVIFHAFPAALPGGFVGVDIFFVISGFLIGGLIHRDIERGTFSLAEFYRKRVRRIFPALFVMLAVTLAAGFFLLSPDSYRMLGRNTLSSVLFVSNIDFWRTSGYFDPEAELRPLLHTWSLAVEEQFYIVFPIVLLVALHFARCSVLPLLGLIFLVSLGLSEWVLSRSGAGMGAYFLTPFRIYELVLGSLAALAPTLAALDRPAVRSACVAAGLALVAASVALLSSQVPFPGLTALLPTVGTTLVLYAGRAGMSPPARLLTSRPFLFVGAISYSLYLWHWPVYSYLRIVSQPGHPDPAAILLATGLILGLSTLSYRFVERPIVSQDITAVPFLTLGGAGMAIAAVAAGTIWQSGGLPSRFAPETLRIFATVDDISPERKRCHEIGLPYDKTCVLGAPDVAPDTVIWGDSHGVELAYALGVRAASEGRSVRQITGSACPPLPGMDFAERPVCRSANDARLARLVADDRVTRVILAINAEGYLAKQGIPLADMQTSLTETVAALRASGKEVVLLGQIPNPRMDVPAVAGQMVHRGRDPSQVGRPRDEIDQIAAGWNAMLRGLAQQDGIDFLDPATVLCQKNLCPIVRDGEVLYFNAAHISQTAAHQLAGALAVGAS